MIFKNITHIKEFVKIKTNGNCYTQFDGINEYIEIPATGDLSFAYNEAFSLSAWINQDNAGQYGIIGSQGPSDFEGYIFRVDFGKIYIGLVGDNDLIVSNKLQVETVSTIPPGQWVHVVMTYNGVNNPTGINFYANGVLQTPKNVISDNLVSGMDSVQPVQLGAQEGPALASFFDGFMSNAAIFNGALTAAQVLNIYNRGRIGSNYADIPSVISHWRELTLNPIDEIGPHNATSINMDQSNIICV